MEEEFVKFYSGLSAAKRSLTRKMLKEEGIGFDSFSISKHPPGLAEVGLSFSQQRLSFPDRLDPRGPSARSTKSCAGTRRRVLR
jgi:hypothetical protein